MGFDAHGYAVILLRGNIQEIPASRCLSFSCSSARRLSGGVRGESCANTLKRLSWDDTEGFLIGVENDHRLSAFKLATNLSDAQG